MTHPTGNTAANGPTYTTDAYAAVEKAAKSRRALYAPSVLQHAAELLTDLWNTGERHGVAAAEWRWAVDLAGGTLDVVGRRYERPETERTGAEVFALAGHLAEALTSEEIGLSAKLGPGASVIVERGPDTPRGGFHGDADIEVRIYSDGGWNFAFNANGASIMSIVAPASQAGASQVADIVRAFVRGELGNPFRP